MANNMKIAAMAEASGLDVEIHGGDEVARDHNLEALRQAQGLERSRGLRWVFTFIAER